MRGVLRLPVAVGAAAPPSMPHPWLVGVRMGGAPGGSRLAPLMGPGGVMYRHHGAVWGHRDVVAQRRWRRGRGLRGRALELQICMRLQV